MLRCVVLGFAPFGPWLVAAALATACRAAPPPPPSAPAPRHVVLLHLDGYRADLTRGLLEAGSLPHLAFLASRGRISYRTSTVDKSETMKVVQSYLTSQLDTAVVGWWQFDRRDFRFRNYWLDPAEVLNYALGLTFPSDPTIQDFLASRGENLVSAMSLARRSVPFENYGRAYLEGIDAVSSHAYHRQADATMASFLDIHRRIAERNERSPALSTLVLAAADELAHLEGITTASDETEHCFRRGEGDDTVFRLLDGDADHAFGGRLRELEPGYFTRVRRAALGPGVEEVCVALPEIEGSNGSLRRAVPDVVLSMIVLDIELGYLIDCFESLRFGPDGARRIERPESLAAPPEDSLFASTLFLAFGDHGMVDTPRGMVDGVSESFIGYLDRELGLTTGADAATISETAELGIDYLHLPKRLREPDLYPEWQSEPVRALTAEARGFAEQTLTELRSVAGEGLYESYWWLFFLRSMLIDPKLDEALGEISGQAGSVLRGLYLRSLPAYRDAELDANRAYFDRYVRLVYGGGARNNAELFLPVCESGACVWSRRPSYAEMSSFRDGRLLQALESHPGVDLLFLRRENELFAAGAPLPAVMEIEVRDRTGNRGTITVRRDRASGELLFHYRTELGSTRDPLGYDRLGRGTGTSGTYNEWVDWTLDESYVNAVGGIGAYLYSDNPAIGDVLVMHATGWNFGDNRGGHGGLHRQEKTTFLLASGPGIEPGELRSKARFRSTPDGRLVPAELVGRHAPTLLDLTPTALEWLGYSRVEIESFARSGFPEALDAWAGSQRSDILAHLDAMRDVNEARSQAGLDDVSLAPLLPRIERLLAFIETDQPMSRSGLEKRPLLGNSLELR